MTKIEWTHIPGMAPGKTWNPVVGCSVVSPGCTNCYAMKAAARQVRMAEGAGRTSHYQDLTRPTKAGPVWTGAVRMAPDHILTAPLKVRAPTPWFVNSMGDLFHESVSDEQIDRVFAVMALCPQHVFIILTKRAWRMRQYVEAKRANAPEWVHLESVHGKVLLPYEGGWPTNVWLGVSAEDQTRANERIPELLATPAAMRLVSCEPLLGPVDLTHIRFANDRGNEEDWDALDLHLEVGDAPFSDGNNATLDWVIAGGESGPGARPMHPAWARALRDQCAAAGVPFFFKQWGEWLPSFEDTWAEIAHEAEKRGHDISTQIPFDAVVWDGERWQQMNGSWDDHEQWYVARNYQEPEQELIRVGKKRAGDLLDGEQHHNWPKPQHTEETT